MTDFTAVVRFLSRKLVVPLAVLPFLYLLPAVGQEQKPDEPIAVEPTGEALAFTAGKLPGKSSAVTEAAVSSAFSGAPEAGPYRVSTIRASADLYLAISVEFKTVASRAAYRDPGASMFAANDRFADVFIATDAAFNRLLNNPQVIRAEVVGEASVPPPPPLRLAPSSKLVPEPVVRGGLDGYTGKGVIVAIVDSGLDFRHPDFITTDAAGKPVSRLLYFWDTFISAAPPIPGTQAPLRYPNGVSVGALYSRAQINDDLHTGLHRIPDPDAHSHGTAAAGIAAGNGRGSNGRWIGVAPQADLIGVRIGDASGAVPHMYLLNAVIEWLFQVARAEGKALVISCSFGGQMGPRSGERVFERHLSSHFGVTPGRVMLVAAGNEREKALHAKVRFGGADRPALLAWCADGKSAIELYFSSIGTAINPSDIAFEPVRLRWSPAATNGCGSPGVKVVEKLAPLGLNPISKEAESIAEVGNGPGGLQITSRSGRSYLVDAYFAGGASGSGFYDSINTGSSRVKVLFPAEQISSPGTARYVLTIGSYDWNDQFDGATQSSGGAPVTPGQLSRYSNPGYSRAGVIKPAIVAPGQYWTTSNAHRGDGSLVQPRGSDRTGNYRIFNGTSAATPYAAGIVALMLQKNPGLSMLDVSNYFMRNATVDAKTGQVPNFDWGYGKLDLAAARRILAAVPPRSAPPGPAMRKPARNARTN